jgi:UDP-N-acetylglucosamine--N-acetylmuramyl-(pentapeptide) pyrophosphoryl-undecaprenol N-acetylglucosamine transferase
LSRRLTIVAYAVNGSGLGHLTRMLAILRWIKRLAPLAGVTPEIYLLTSSEACAMALEEGIAAFKIPSKTVIKNTDIPKENYLRLAKQWIWHSIGLIRPDILLVDTFPAGTFGELFQALDGPKAKVLIYRAVKEAFAKQEAISALLPLYDRILLPEEAGQPPREILPEISAKTKRVGPITLRSYEEMRPRADARKRLGIEGDELAIFLSAGGGGDPNAEKVLLSVIETLRSLSNIFLIVGGGPLYKGEIIRGKNITWLSGFFASEDFLGLDLGISAAGYNSFHELLHAGVPTIFYSQEKIADEQFRRVEAASQAGAAFSLPVSEQGTFEKETLLGLIEKLREEDTRKQMSEKARALVPKSAAREAAAQVLATLIPKRNIEEALQLGDHKFFTTLHKHQLSFVSALEVLSAFAPEEVLSASERRQLFFSLLQEISAQSLILFLSLYRKFSLPKSFSEAQEAVFSTSKIVSCLQVFRDERGALSLIKLLPIDKLLSLRTLSEELCRFLELLQKNGESLFRGMAILSQHLGPLSQERSLWAVLEHSCQELES